MKKIITFSGLISIVICISCLRDFSQIPVPETRELTSLEKKLVETDERFSLKLFRELNKVEHNKNIFISPFSAGMALAMTFNGAAGTTEEEMRKTLEYGDLSLQEINESYKSLLALLSELDPQVQLQIANSIWYQISKNIKQEFIERNKTYFNAEIRELDLYAPGVLDMINGWVSSQTNGKVNDIIEEIEANTVMFLINAIYFKGIWTYEFDKNQTKDDHFILHDGSLKPCKMMEQHREFYYYENELLQAVDMEYGNGKYSMTILLPKSGISIDSLISRMNSTNFSQWTGNFTKTEGSVLLPKFKIEYRILLNDVLTSLGMGIAFGWFADFSNMNGEKSLYIDNVIHQSYVEVDEEGTEAAAATVVVMREKSIGNSGFTFHLNRSFLFFIRERQNNVILFIGKVVEPTS